jgi:hypothetical protein
LGIYAPDQQALASQYNLHDCNSDAARAIAGKDDAQVGAANHIAGFARACNRFAAEEMRSGQATLVWGMYEYVAVQVCQAPPR